MTVEGPPILSASWGAEGPPDPPPRGQGALDPSCAQARKGGPGGFAPRAGGLGAPSAPPRQQRGLGDGTPPHVWSDYESYGPPGMSASFVTITR